MVTHRKDSNIMKMPLETNIPKFHMHCGSRVCVCLDVVFSIKMKKYFGYSFKAHEENASNLSFFAWPQLYYGVYVLLHVCGWVYFHGFRVTVYYLHLWISHFSRFSLGCYLWWNTSAWQIASKMFHSLFFFFASFVPCIPPPVDLWLRSICEMRETNQTISIDFMRYQREYDHLVSITQSRYINLSWNKESHATHSFRISLCVCMSLQ